MTKRTLTTLNAEEQRQHALQKKRDYALRMVEKKVREIKRAATSITLWQRRGAYYQRELGITLVEKRLIQEARKAKRPKVRKISL